MSRLSQLYLAARRDPDLVVLEGVHVLKHAWRYGVAVEDVVTCEKITLTRAMERLSPELVAKINNIENISREEFNTLTPEYIKTGIVGIAPRPQTSVEEILERPGIVVVLDSVRNLNNLGAIVRTAAARGVAGIIYSGTLDAWHPTCVSVSRGLHFAVPVVRVAAVAEVLKIATGREIIGLDERGTELGRGEIPTDAVLCLGSERTGLSEATKQHISNLKRIPMVRGVSSLNLATAAAIAMYR